MDLTLDLVKSDNDVWGFRLKGGAEYELPFLVVHVGDNSVAENCGLRCNDVIVSVNGTSTEGLVHSQAHDLLVAARNRLVLGIKRGLLDLISPMTCDDESNDEVYNIMQGCIESEEELEQHRQVDFEIVNPEEKTNVEAENGVLPQRPVEEQNGAPGDFGAPLRENAISGVKDRKWSSFLQKPKRPVPALKKPEEEGPKAAPYRVIITKQKKKSPEELKNKNLEESKIEEEVPQSEPTETIEDDEQDSIISHEEEVPHGEENEEGKEVVYETEERPDEESINEDREKEDRCLDDITEEDISESQNKAQKEEDAEIQKFLGEKLAEVQKQLEALSKLPSTMQSTIDALNRQLADLVGLAKPAQEDEDKDLLKENSESGDDAAEQMLTEDENEERDEGTGEQLEENGEEQEEEQVDKEADREPELTEEEKEALRIEEELKMEALRIEQEQLEKQEKEQSQLEESQQRRLKQRPTLPSTPIERPIILPGGRRWSQPDDVYPVFKNKKMSDERIANTIETYSEVISGRLKGINFLKYTPPPKNLDYLQKSDVYKLIHHLEPPIRGICSRQPKILAEEDYYQDQAG